MALLPADRAIWADSTVTGEVPKALENRTRRCFPPMDTWTTWRNVLLVKPGGGGRLRGSVNCCDELHVLIQWPPCARQKVAAREKAKEKIKVENNLERIAQNYKWSAKSVRHPLSHQSLIWPEKPKLNGQII
jgi:hypothetical protein